MLGNETKEGGRRKRTRKQQREEGRTGRREGGKEREGERTRQRGRPGDREPERKMDVDGGAMPAGRRTERKGGGGETELRRRQEKWRVARVDRDTHNHLRDCRAQCRAPAACQAPEGQTAGMAAFHVGHCQLSSWLSLR